MQSADPNSYDVIVIGAGMSGLAAARTLAESGLRVLILEAQQRIGGRIYTLHHGSEVIELGAEFIHGQPEDLWALIQEANLETYERTGDFLQAKDGDLTNEEQQDDQNDPIEALTHYTGPDQSFADYISHLNLSPEAQTEAIAYVEGFNAADAREASIIALGRQQTAEDAIEGDRVWRIKEGYDQLPAYLRTRFEAAGGTLILGARVIEIDWSRHNVLIRTDTAEFHAPKAVITLPLGVLQSNTVRFTPQPEILQAATQMRMGQARRLTLLFKRRLWPEDMSFLIARTVMPPVWWNAYPSASLTITGWVGGPRTTQLSTLTQEDLIQTACTALAQALNLSAEEILAELADLWTHNWSADPHTQGAYSWVPVNGIAASSTLSQPVEDTLYFAGEHTDTTGHWGTVHAALRTGIRAANQILESPR